MVIVSTLPPVSSSYIKRSLADRTRAIWLVYPMRTGWPSTDDTTVSSYIAYAELNKLQAIKTYMQAWNISITPIII